MKLVREHINEEFIAQEILNEKFDINFIKDKVKKAAILASMFLLMSSGRGVENLPSKQEIQNNPKITTLVNKENLSWEEISKNLQDLFYSYYRDQINYDILQDPMTLKTSSEGLEFIKNHEKLNLEGYEIGDGQITIGWGHAEPLDKSIYNVGQKITEREAEVLFRRDVQRAENGLKRLFQLWTDQGLNIKVSQHMWDSMVSMSFNMGIGGFRGSNVVQALKKEEYFKAADSILKTKVKNIDSFPGLRDRREAEKELFLKNLV